MSRNRLLARLGVFLLPLAAWGCSDANSTPDQTASRGFTRVASVQFEAPLLYQRGEETIGPTKEIVEDAMERINQEREAQGSRPFELLWAKREYGQLLDAVAAGEVEMAAGVIAVTDQRGQRVDFTTPYYRMELALAINPASKQFNAEELAGKSIGVRQGTVVESWLKERHPDARAVLFPTLDPALLALRRGEVDGVVDDRNMLAYSLGTVAVMRAMEILPGTLETFDVAIAVPKGSNTLLGALNAAIEEAKESGELDQWMAEHIGDRTEKVSKRHENRLARERMAVEPRNFVVRVSKERNSAFDIYKIANLSFTLRNTKTGESRGTSRVKFNSRTGYASTKAPPGEYKLYLPKVFGNDPLGEVLIKPDDGKRVNYNLVFRADRTVTLLAASQ